MELLGSPPARYGRVYGHLFLGILVLGVLPNSSTRCVNTQCCVKYWWTDYIIV